MTTMTLLELVHGGTDHLGESMGSNLTSKQPPMTATRWVMEERGAIAQAPRASQ